MAATTKAQMFVEYVLGDEKLDAYNAAIKAGYAESTAQKHSYMWVQDDKSKCTKNYWSIWELFQEAKAKRMERMNFDADYVLKRLVDFDQLDPIEILNDDLTLKPLSQWPKHWRLSISGVDLIEISSLSEPEQKEAILKKIKWPDKVKNLELLGKHTKVQAFKEQVESKNTLVGPSNIKIEFVNPSNNEDV